MKQTLALILTTLFFFTAITPSVLAAEPTGSFDTVTVTDGNKPTGTDGSTTPPDGLENIVSTSAEVIDPVITVTSSAITLTSFDEPYRTDAVAFAVGTSQEALSKWFADSVAGFTGYDADGTPYDLVSGTWSLDAVDTVTTGVYYASVAPDLGTEYTLADGASLPRQLCAVSIQTPGELNINCCVAGRGFLHFPWILSDKQEEQLDAFAVWLRQDGGEWINLSDGFCFTSQDLQLSQRVLTYESTYELKVTYPGGQTGVLTFEYDGELSIIDYSGGDRDGGDAGGNGSGAGTQPAPTHPKTPNDSNEDNSESGGNNTLAPEDSSPKSNDTPQDSGSTPGKLQKPQEEPGSSSSETQPPPTATQAPSGSQNNENHKRNDNSQVQISVTEKPLIQTPSTPTESSVPVYSHAAFSYEAESTFSEQGNNAAAQLETNAKAVMNTVPGDNSIQSDKISKSQVSVAVTESYSPTQTIISGLRLRNLCADDERVVFGSGDLTVSIPSSLLLGLNLSDSETLIVKLNQPKNNQILLAVEFSGKAVTELAETVLRLPYMPQSKNAHITIQNEAGQQITDVSYDGELLRFKADVGGTYTIIEKPNTQETHKDMLPLLLVSGGLILAGGGITFFRRRRHG